MRRQFWICAGLASFTLALYWQAFSFGFVNFDDDRYVLENRRVQIGLSLENAVWSFTAVHYSNWHPLTTLSLMLDAQFYGKNAPGYHVTNVCWHTANVILLFVLLSRMTGAGWKSACVAGLFALHPLHVESVAWVSERKDVLSTFFGLASLYAYSRYAEGNSGRWYLCCVGAFVLSLLSKQTLVTLPFLLLLLDFWPLRRMTRESMALEPAGAIGEDVSVAPNQRTEPRCPIASRRRLLLEKLPFLALAAIFCTVAIVVQSRSRATVMIEGLSLSARCANAVLAYVLYIKQTFWPNDLAAFYPHPQSHLNPLAVAAAAFLLAVVSAVVIWSVKRRPFLFVGWFWYLGTLVPMIGIVQVGAQQMADRYTYVPIVGLFIAVTWLLAPIAAAGWWQRTIVVLAASTAFVVLTITSWKQIAVWRTSLSLWQHALAVTDDNATAHNNLGMAFSDAGRLEEAARQFRRTLEIDPDYVHAHCNLGVILAKTGKIDEADKHCQTAYRLRPDDERVRYSLGVTRHAQGRLNDAVAHYTAGLRLNPDNVMLHNNLGLALSSLGRNSEALHHLQAAVHIDPESGQAHFNLANVLDEEGHYLQALKHYQRAVALNPKSPAVHNNLGVFYFTRLRQREPAIEHFREALRLDPNYTDAFRNLRRARDE